LGTVGEILASAATEAAVSNGHLPCIPVKGLFKNASAMQEIFRAVAAKSDGGLIDKRTLSIVIMSHAAGKSVESGRGAGPIIAASCRMGYIVPMINDKGKHYILTEKARTTFDLIFEAYKGNIVPVEKPSKLRAIKRCRKRSKDASAEKMLAYFTKAIVNCQKLEKIQDSIADLEAKVLKFGRRITKLKKLAQKPALLESAALMAQIPTAQAQISHT
jgi:hypothetical protein